MAVTCYCLRLVVCAPLDVSWLLSEGIHLDEASSIRCSFWRWHIYIAKMADSFVFQWLRKNKQVEFRCNMKRRGAAARLWLLRL